MVKSACIYATDFHQVLAQKKGLAEAEARFCFQQLIMAVDYCHCLGISMRDVKVGPPPAIHTTDSN